MISSIWFRHETIIYDEEQKTAQEAVLS
jgi:hypothetical protein